MRGGDEMKKWSVLISLLFLAAVLSAGLAEGAGTLTVTFKYRNSSGVEQPLAYAFVYLRNAAAEPPLEKYFSPADYIIGPTDSSGRITASVPEGDYYVRITRRYTLEGRTRPYGPPEPGDYTWNQAKPITISANTATSLGTIYAVLFGTSPITISGTVTTYGGVPLANRYVRFQKVQCITADYSSQDPSQWRDSNRCGPDKHLGLQRTDANGSYSLVLRDPGTYYVYETACLGDQHQQYSGNPCLGAYGGTVTVNVGDKKTVNLVGF